MLETLKNIFTRKPKKIVYNFEEALKLVQALDVVNRYNHTHFMVNDEKISIYTSGNGADIKDSYGRKILSISWSYNSDIIEDIFFNSKATEDDKQLVLLQMKYIYFNKLQDYLISESKKLKTSLETYKDKSSKYESEIEELKKKNEKLSK